MILGDHDRIDVHRRQFLQVGYCGFLGFGLERASGESGRGGGSRCGKAGPEPGRRTRAKSMILVFLTGGLSHLDSFDMKPDAPEGIRGEFQPIATSVPGIRFCEHLPELAARADKLAIVRSLAHTYTNHLNATHELLTGHPQPGAFFDKIASRDDYPCYRLGARRDPAARRRHSQRGDAAHVPDGRPARLARASTPGFLGPRHDPWQIRQDPSTSRLPRRQPVAARRASASSGSSGGRHCSTG